MLKSSGKVSYLSTMKKMHPTQEKLLKILKKNIDDPLTIQELADNLGITAPSVVFHHIQQLENKGFLKRNPSNPKDYQILGEPEKPIVYINKYGLAQCGRGESILDGSPLERIPIASKLLKFSAKDAFIVEARGNSMEPEIESGDLIIAKKQHDADNNEMVVCVNDGSPMIKLFRKEKNSIKLISLNTKHKEITPDDDFHIEGVVKNIIHYK